MDFDMIVLWPQQEDDSQLSQSAFLSIITEFQSDFTADISRMSNDEVAEVMFVTNGFTRDPSGAATFSEQTLGQMQFALENHGENNAPETCKSILATPSYILHRAADLIHFTNIAGARDGSYMGRAAANRKLGRDAKPFHITSIAWVSGQIRCNLHLPYDAGTLTETSPWVTDPGQNGFKLQKVSNGSDHPLASVFILGQQIIAVPSPGYSTTDEYELSWALRGPPGNLDGPTTGARCPFNDGSLDTDFFGNPMPNHLASGRANIFLT
jgi:hypothetical protein